ncbi:hypothetical protein [Sinorhizobium meliloti]|uniref:hypothetical protein n=1 Tax=Rhizobium meliloti TaxID=382 RepID=UPI000FD9D837|nr:hypothetical protein [Sinorhizobium meliloti]MCO6426041.1 hypothetical protein [Sinorhizobium meliloti]RVL38766.1 hypothetical protein CN148_09665 [Sinorhizobium meliloti]
MKMDYRLSIELDDREILDRIHMQESAIREFLQVYEPKSTIFSWLDTLRAIEECINLLMADWSAVEGAFFSDLLLTPVNRFLSDPTYLIAVRERMAAKFNANFAARFGNLIVQCFAIRHSFALHGIHGATEGLANIGSMIGYFQSRRRHLVAMLHLMPHVCRGNKPFAPLDTLNVVLPLVELYALPMSGCQTVLNVRAAREKLGLSDGTNEELAMLSPLFLEPERAPIVDMPITADGIEILKSREQLRDDRLFSAAELRNDIILIEAAYAEFDLSASDFPPCSKLIRKLSTDYIDRDFWIAITPPDLQRLFRRYAASRALQDAFVNKSASYTHCLSTYAPMVLVGGIYRSTVTLLSRFLYNWRARCLDRKKRYQIRSGFIFEHAVAAELGAQGFEVQAITRVSRAEFDVVTVKDGVIWNVQCKNNFTHLDQVGSDADRFARYNRNLAKAYENALQKEVRREHLLKKHLGIDHIQHMLVSRFPVVTDNARILPFTRVGDFAKRAEALAREAKP